MIDELVTEIETQISAESQTYMEERKSLPTSIIEKITAARLLAILKWPHGVNQSIALSPEPLIRILSQPGLAAIMKKYAIAYLPEHFTLEDDNTVLRSINDQKAVIVIIPDGVKKIGPRAFAQCTSLTAVILPNDPIIGESAFLGCTSLTAVILSGRANIGRGAFAQCTSLTAVTLPDGAIIGEAAFLGCTSLTAVTLFLQDQVKPSYEKKLKHQYLKHAGSATIGKAAFLDCTSLTTVTLSGSGAIEENAFSRSTSLTTVSISGNIAVNQYAFSTLKSLTNLRISGRAIVETHAFDSCSSLAAVTIVCTGLETVKKNAFSNCASLTTINFSGKPSLRLRPFMVPGLDPVFIKFGENMAKVSPDNLMMKRFQSIGSETLYNTDHEALLFYHRNAQRVHTNPSEYPVAIRKDLAALQSLEPPFDPIVDELQAYCISYAKSLQYIIVSHQMDPQNKRGFLDSFNVRIIDRHQLSFYLFNGHNNQPVRCINQNSLPAELSPVRKNDLLSSFLSLDEINYYLKTVSTMLLIGVRMRGLNQPAQQTLPDQTRPWLMLATYSLQPIHETEKAPHQSLANISLITVYRQLKSIFADKKITSGAPSGPGDSLLHQDIHSQPARHRLLL